MDPILEEMQRVKSPNDMKESRFRDWVTYLCALVARKDDEIATLKAQLDAYAGMPEQMILKRGPGRPRKDESHVG